MAAPKDAKSAILRRQGLLHPRSHLVTEPLFGSHEFFDPRDLVQVKYEMLRCVWVEGRSVTAIAAAFGFSRQAFYQAQAAYQRQGLPGLLARRPGPRRAHKLSDDVVDFLLEERARDPTLRAAALAGLIQERFDRTVHPRSLERALTRRQKKGRSVSLPRTSSATAEPMSPGPPAMKTCAVRFWKRGRPLAPAAGRASWSSARAWHPG